MNNTEILRSSLMKAEKGLMERVATMVLSKPELLKDLFGLCVSNEKVVSWRAAWVLNHLTRKNKEFVSPLIPDMIKNFPDLKYDGQKACFLRCLSYYDLHQENLGTMLDECLNFLQKESSRPFIISYALDFLQRICMHVPELSREVSITISAHMAHFPTAYLQKKATRVMKQLNTFQQAKH